MQAYLGDNQDLDMLLLEMWQLCLIQKGWGALPQQAWFNLSESGMGPTVVAKPSG